LARWRRYTVSLLLALCLPTPAPAEIGASLSILTDSRYRGRSLSEGRPVATLDLSYDDVTGLYLGGSATAVATAHSGVQLLGFQENIGYARRLGSGPVVDFGIIHSNYTEYFSGGYKAQYNEAYLGLITKHFSSHIYYSPNYFRRGLSTVYADADVVVRPAEKWRLNAHFGVLAPMSGDQPTGYDWRLAVATQMGALDLQLAWSGGGPRPDYYADRPHGHHALVLGIAYIF
jgi:uncharacterized protein (TIGR02001 family)